MLGPVAHVGAEARPSVSPVILGGPGWSCLFAEPLHALPEQDQPCDRQGELVAYSRMEKKLPCHFTCVSVFVCCPLTQCFAVWCGGFCLCLSLGKFVAELLQALQCLLQVLQQRINLSGS